MTLQPPALPNLLLPVSCLQNGTSPLGIAKRLGYISVIDVLKLVTEESVSAVSHTQRPLVVEASDLMSVCVWEVMCKECTFCGAHQVTRLYLAFRGVGQDTVSLQGWDNSLTGGVTMGLNMR